MVKGLNLFRERFAPFERHFVLIGGAACFEWFATQDLQFRSTKDIDMVVLIEAIDRPFVSALRTFLEEGGYQKKERSDGSGSLRIRVAAEGSSKTGGFAGAIDNLVIRKEQ